MQFDEFNLNDIWIFCCVLSYSLLFLEIEVNDQ